MTGHLLVKGRIELAGQGRRQEARRFEARLKAALGQGKPTEEPRYEFSSTQFNLSEAASDILRAWAAKRIFDVDLHEEGREKCPHVTVRYGLHATDGQDVARVVAEEGPVTVKLGSISLFETPEYDVVKIDVESPDLHRLNAALAALPHTDTHPEYKPHLTLAYTLPGTGKTYVGLNYPLFGVSLTFDTLLFSSKTGEKTPIRLIGKSEVRSQKSEGDGRASAALVKGVYDAIRAAGGSRTEICGIWRHKATGKYWVSAGDWVSKNTMRAIRTVLRGRLAEIEAEAGPRHDDPDWERVEKAVLVKGLWRREAHPRAPEGGQGRYRGGQFVPAAGALAVLEPGAEVVEFDRYGLREVEFGDWPRTPEGTEQLRMVARAFDDLAGLLGGSPEAIALSGRLALAFDGDPGRDWRGQYDHPAQTMHIGVAADGQTVAHEWAHFLDHTLGTLHGVGDHLGLLSLGLWFAEGERTPVSEALHEVTRLCMDARYEVHDRQGTRHEKSVFDVSAAFDDKDGRLYYSKPSEMFARCFEVWAAAKLAESGRGDSPLLGAERLTSPLYPREPARGAIVAAVNRLVEELKGGGWLSKAVAALWGAGLLVKGPWDPEKHARAPKGTTGKYRGGQFVPKEASSFSVEAEEPGGRLARALRRVENETITVPDREISHVFGPDGELRHRKVGEPRDEKGAEITYTAEERASWPGGIYTHNHPFGTSFTKEDLINACVGQVAECRACAVDRETGERIVYRARPPFGNQFDIIHWNAVLRTAWDAAEAVVSRQHVAAIEEGRMTKEQANWRYRHDVWMRVAGATGLRYTRERLEEA